MYKITIEHTTNIQRMKSFPSQRFEKEEGGHEWEAPPDREMWDQKTHEIYRQIVDELDLAAVIKAVNRMSDD